MTVRILPLLLFVGGCAAADASSAGSEDGLARELAGRVAGEPVTCVSPSPAESLTAVDRRTVVLRRGRTIFVNRLDADCPGLGQLNTLIVESHGGRYCRGDRVRGLEPGTTIPGPACPLRDFTPYRTAQGG